MKSDDTEVLLLIPPDFFLLQDSEESARNSPFSCETEFPEILENTYPEHWQVGQQQLSEQRMEGSVSFLREIDSFLKDHGAERTPGNQSGKSIINLSDISMRDLQPLGRSGDFETMPSGDLHEKAQNALQRHTESMGRMRGSREFETSTPAVNRSLNFSSNIQDAPLINLSELWCSQGAAREAASLQEERLRREHCEKSIHLLQARILEYQQKLAVAMEVDRTKNETIAKLKDNLARIEAQNNHLKTELRDRNGELERRCAFLEAELGKSSELTRDLQNKNEVFHAKIIHLTKANDDVKEITKKQMEDLQVRLSNSLRVEQLLNDDLVKAKKDLEEGKTKLHDMEKEVQEAKTATEAVLKEKSSLQTAFDLLNEKLKSISEDTQAQQSYLKSYYQEQLNSVVAEKVKEFQLQLDTAEAEAQNLSLLCQKQEKEIALLSEKHSEELSLSHLQLVVATKTIEELREKLSQHESRRMDIAQRLHGVMEVQWQKALEILSNPTPDNTARAQKFSLREDFYHPPSRDFSLPPKHSREKREDPEDQLQEQMQNFMKALLRKSLTEMNQEPIKDGNACEDKGGDRLPSKMRSKQRPWSEKKDENPMEIKDNR